MTLHDDTFNDVVQVESLFKFDLLNFKVISVQEFSRMVYTHPERLQKK